MTTSIDSKALQAGLKTAYDCITPVWPLDRYIAVNPWWNLSRDPLQDCAAKLAFWRGAHGMMPRDSFRDQWENGRIRERHLILAAESMNVDAGVEALCEHLQQPRRYSSLHLVTDELDRLRDLRHSVSWHDEVVNRISRYCCGCFDRHQAQWSGESGPVLYSGWRRSALQDRGVEMLMNVRGLREQFGALPEDDSELIEVAVQGLPLTSETWPHYAAALLLSVGGWASYCAYLEWEANPDAARTSNPLRQLLAIRLAWELVLWRHSGSVDLEAAMRHHAQRWPEQIAQHREQLEWDWVWQRALEWAYQDELVGSIESGPPCAVQLEPRAEAVFCIDVRSEPFRRALEQESGGRVRTRGFAGFFGVPIAFQPAGSDHAIPHLPGLLAPRYVVHEQDDAQSCCGNSRRKGFWSSQIWSRFTQSGVGIFGFVESLGMQYGLKLVKEGLLSKPESCASPVHAVGGRLWGAEGEVALEDRVALVHGALRGMAMTKAFAPVVLLVGHGSSTQNNPHAASLDCGACCGQRGEVNSRLLASLLNDAAIRSGLHEKGVCIPDTTCFLAALHDTTLDRIELFTQDLPVALEPAVLAELREWFAKAGVRVRRERAGRLGLQADSDEALEKEFKRYALDWSQVRPEWGLAGNAAFVIAPRSRTLGLNLRGRSFLHEYHASDDPDGSVLEQIMTAPMIVTHWINLQYYASTVDPLHYGAGNKVIHNVVGGSIGVLEGNSGDLRIGLPLQSLHDGSHWVHEPIRLNVLIEAPAQTIEQIIETHQKVRELIDGQWLYLFRIDSQDGRVLRYDRGSWVAHFEDGAGTRSTLPSSTCSLMDPSS